MNGSLHSRLDELKKRGDPAAIVSECELLLGTNLSAKERAFVLRQLGVNTIRVSETNLDRAICLFTEAVELTVRAPEERGAALANLATAYGVIGALDKAQHHLRRLESHLRRHPLPDLQKMHLIAVYNVAYAFDHADQLDTALSLYNQAISLAAGDPIEARAANNLANLFLRMGRLSEAEHALRIARRHQVPEIEALVLNNESLLCLAKGDRDGAVTLVNQALVHPSAGEERHRGQVLLTLARIELAAGSASSAAEIAQRALDIGQREHCALLTVRACRLLQALATEEVS